MAESSMALASKEDSRETNELRIIQAARQDPRAFGELYILYVEQVFRYLYSRIGNVQEAEDAAAQTFLAAFESFARFRQDEHFASWLFTIARSKTIDHFRRKRAVSSIDEAADIATNPDPLYGIIQSEQAAALSKLTQALPEEDRELLRLRFLAGMSFPEIAHFIHRNEGAVKKTIYRLLARLHSQLEVSNE